LPERKSSRQGLIQFIWVRFSCSDEALIKTLDNLIETDSRQGSHLEHPAHIGPTTESGALATHLSSFAIN